MSARISIGSSYSKNSPRSNEDVSERLSQHLLNRGKGSGKGRILLIYGPMGSGKSALALRLVERIVQHGQSPLCIAAGIKRRTAICARNGSRIPAYPSSEILHYPAASHPSSGPLIIDEAQFLTPSEVNSLCVITEEWSQRAVCFGLYWNSEGVLFDGTQALLRAGVLPVPISHNLRCWCGERATSDIIATATSNQDTKQYISVCEEHMRSRQWTEELN